MEGMSQGYIHGYDERELRRLQDQASTLAELLHAGTVYPSGSRVLEVGCGIGAQTIPLARRSPEALITAVDISEPSLQEARKAAAEAGLTNVTFQRADLQALPFPEGTFDHLFVCFVLEHLPTPQAALSKLRKMLKVGGTLTVIEGDHGSAYFYPESAAAIRAIQCQVKLQSRAGGNALIGRSLYPLLTEAGFTDVRVSPRVVYVDGSRPDLAQGFTRKTFTAMIEGIREAAVSEGLMNRQEMDRGIAALYRASAPDGVFCYTFFKAVAIHVGEAPP